MRVTRFLLAGLLLLSWTGASAASAAVNGRTTRASAAAPSTAPTFGTADTGGAGLGAPAAASGTAAPSAAAPSTAAQPTVPGDVAKIIKGVGYAPSLAPMQVKKAIWAGNQIRHKPYIYAGGHGVWKDAGYDCSGSVSYVLHAAGLLKVSMDSSEFESWGRRGTGHWITVYTNPGHAFVEIAGIRFDTSAEDDPNPPPGTGPRWRPLMTGTGGFTPRHPNTL